MTALESALSLRAAPANRRSILPTVMLAGALITSLAVLLLLIVIVWLSFIDGTPGDVALSYTLNNYTDVFENPVLYRVLWNTIAFSAITLAVALVLGLPMAWLVERTDLPGKPVMLTLMTVGLLFPGFAVALGWLFLLHPRIGVINQMAMELFGLTEAPFDISTVTGMGIINGLTLAPVAFIMTGIVLRTMDPVLEEAAKMSGANLTQTIARVTLPLAWPGILAASIYVFTIGFAAFDVPAIIGLASRIYTYSTFLYQYLLTNSGLPEYGGIAVLSVIMIIFALIMTWLYARVSRRAPKYAVITGKGYRPALVQLGRYRWAALAFMAIFFALVELLPFLMLAWTAGLPYLQAISAEAFAQLSLENFRSLPHDLVLGGLRNTALLMLLVPTITVILSIAISWVVLRSKIPGRAAFDFFAFLPHTVPSIVFSVAALLLALFVLQNVLPIYGTIWILVFVYTITRVSYGTRMTNSALIQIHRELEESATMCGASLGGIMRSVILPLLAPALAYTWIWVALLAYRELTLPVLLATVDTQPLAMVVWSFVSGAAFGKAAAISLLMVALMLPILLFYWVIARRTGITTM